MRNDLVFIVGAPRSGTTWVKSLICEHHRCVSHPNELTLFNNYVRQFEDMWDYEMTPINSGKWSIGLPTIWSEKQKNKFINDFISQVYNELGAKHGQLIVDKHPGYAKHLDLIWKYLPNAKVINVIRDGRNMAMSMVDVNGREGFGWENIAVCAAKWDEHVRTATDSGLLKPKLYLNIYYEDLLNRPMVVLQSMFDFLGLEMDKDGMNEIIASNDFSKKKVSSPNNQISKSDRVNQTMWKSLSYLDLYKIELYAGKSLRKHGYVGSVNWWSNNNIVRIFIKIRYRMFIWNKKMKQIFSIIRK